MKYFLIMILALPMLACQRQAQEESRNHPVIPGRDKHGLPAEAKDWQQTEGEPGSTTENKSYEEKGSKGPQAQEEAKDKDFDTETSPQAIDRKQQGE